MDTKQNVFSNLIWRLAERIGAQAVSFIVSIILARLLLPEDYGTIALVMVFTTILNVFVDYGLGISLIQKKETDEIDFSTVFYFNIVLCLVLYLITFLIAPLVARFYNRSDLTSIIRVLSLIVIISSIKNIQQAYVSRNMMFKKFFFATFFGTIVAAVVGIYMAYNGYGVWALVAQQLANASIDTLILWFTVKWRPKKVFSIERLKPLFKYGWKVTASALLDTIYTEIRQIIIGKIYSSEELGYYNKGNQFPNVVAFNLTISIDSVLLSFMSTLQDEKEKVLEVTRKSIRLAMYLIAPLMLGLAAVSERLVIVLLTDKWIECVPYMIILCISYIFYPIQTTNNNSFKSIGKSGLYFKLETIKKVVGLIIVLLTMHISIKAVCLGVLLTNIICQLINFIPNKKVLNYSYLDQIKDVVPFLLMSLIMFGCVYAFGFVDMNIYLTLFLQVVLGIAVYYIETKIFKIEEFEYLKDVLKKLVNKKEGK